MTEQCENVKKTTKRHLEDTEDNETFSFQDFVEHQNELDSKVSAVLGASDETNCSYENGYVYRQALYGCITCLKEKQKSCATKEEELDALHGICLACSFECHPNHELYELYTKRYFRCDCGNSKFNINGKVQQCKFRVGKEEKDQINTLNKYNHNFNGLYCTCDTPYPDENNQTDTSGNDLNNSSSKNIQSTTEENSEEMIQCTICEDWFHSNHLVGYDDLDNTMNDESKTDDIICHICMDKNDFLREYQGYMLKRTSQSKANTSDSNVDVENTIENSEKFLDKENENECVLEKQKLINRKLGLNENSKGTCIFIEGWRDALCRCNKCLELYKQKDVEFLIKPNDTIKYYEDCGKVQDAKKKDEQNKRVNDEFSKLNRNTQIELIHNVNDFKEELKEFLVNFAQSGKVIGPDDVNKFFEELHERKKRKIEEYKMSNANGYYCK